MSEQHTPYITPSALIPFGVTYTDDKPDVLEYLINLRRDLLRKVKQLDELIARLQVDTRHE
jgi:hypothetical protein